MKDISDTNNFTDKHSNLTEVKDAEKREEKLRKRQEQIAAWRKKKEDERKAQEVSKDENSIEVDSLEKKRIRQKRIEDWKRKRQQDGSSTDVQESDTLVTTNHKTSINIKSRIANKAGGSDRLMKRSIFSDNDDNSDYRPKFKKPTFEEYKEYKYKANEENDKNHDNDDDELDLLIQNLENKDLKKKMDISVSILQNNKSGEESGSDEELQASEEEEKQNKLLSIKLQKLQNKEKELDQLNHGMIQYENFRKNFYTEPSELSKLSAEDVELLRIELDGIKVRGIDCPKPILKWSHLGLPSSIISIIEDDLEFSKPSSIQSQALPTIMSGRDMIGVAKTGSGKTLSFVLPMVRHIKDQPPLKKGDGPIGLIMTPTRELALQINKELSNFSKVLDFSVACCYGGSLIENQIAQLKKGATVIVGTPGRIIDLLTANGGRVTNLKRVTYLVLDEADRMFDMGFEPQVTKIFTQVRPDRQTVLFSATFPRKMEHLARKVLTNPIEIIVGGISVVASEITQKVEIFKDEGTEKDLEDAKFDRLIKILEEFHSSKEAKILIFVEKQVAADNLLVRLLSKNYATLTIHGGKDQIDRKHAIKEFSSPNSGINILVATSIAARGLDVKGLHLVINFEAANHMEDYVHRVGRTGRAGMKGTAITFVSSKQERQITDLVKALKLSKVPESEIPTRLIEISDKFLSNLRNGKVKYNSGFGGKGLENLQEIRENAKSLQRKVFNINNDTNNLGELATKTSNSKQQDDLLTQLPDFQIIEGRAPETSGPDKCKFHSRITINDLPQKARWVVVQFENLSKIIESTSTSITNKGQYYPPNSKIPDTIKKNGKESAAPAKLYLLVEGLTEGSVREANSLIRQKMIEGLELASKEESMAPIGKYTV